MHDIKWIRSNPDAFDAAMQKRGLPAASALLLKLDEEKRKLQTDIQTWQSEKNKIAKEIGMAKGKGDQARVDELMLKQNVSDSGAQEKEANLAKLDEQLKGFLETLPNIPANDVPVGTEEEANKIIRTAGKKPEFAFKPKEHFELGEKLGLMSFDEAAKTSGARFVVLKGALAKMERALAAFFLDHNTNEFGYTEVVPPFLVKDNAVYGTGQLPKFEHDLFKATSKYEFGFTDEERKDPNIIKLIKDLEKEGHVVKGIISGNTGQLKRFKAIDNFWLIPTAEVPLTNLVADSILDEEKLPIRMTAYTPCFRAEAGAAGKDTRGMIRQHQFSKVEMVSITHPDKAKEEHERMTNCAESILKKLGLHYQVVLLSSEAGFSNEKTYDIEVWLPGQNAFREISSCSNCGAFQARRMKARFKAKNAKETQFVHTLNGSGLPIGRTIVAILENYQNEDGSITVPKALVPYMGGVEKIG